MITLRNCRILVTLKNIYKQGLISENTWLFWVSQFIIWSYHFLFHVFVLYPQAKTNIDYTGYLFIDSFAGFVLTTLLRYYYTWIRKKWSSKYILSVSVFGASLIFANVFFLITTLLDQYMTHKGYNVSPVSLYYYSKYLLEYFLIFSAWSLLYLFFKLWEEWKANQELELLLKELENQKLEAELNALKSQLNPHFLFNVLNNIYSHSLLKSDLAPSIVLKLSDLMSYILYDCKTDTISLQKEVEFIKNYVELEKVRLEDDIEVKFQIENIYNSLIPPLLFVPLIENAFKHGIGSHPKDKCVSITIQILNNVFFFGITNSVGKINNNIGNSIVGGIGIENVRKRLELLYPNRHSVDITNDIDKFTIEIFINDFK